MSRKSVSESGGSSASDRSAGEAFAQAVAVLMVNARRSTGSLGHQFSTQFKAEAVQMVVGLDRSLADIARDLDINPGTLANWVKAWRGENPDPATATKAARVAEMEAEIRRVRMENEFLKISRGLRRSDASVAERCALIEAEKANYGIRWMCSLMHG